MDEEYAVFMPKDGVTSAREKLGKFSGKEVELQVRFDDKRAEVDWYEGSDFSNLVGIIEPKE